MLSDSGVIQKKTGKLIFHGGCVAVNRCAVSSSHRDYDEATKKMGQTKRGRLYFKKNGIRE
jgi:hypothetical protein